ncbi:MAG: DUF503 domain-containing protein [Chloroflexi bacterium]|nr:DUF503 domain-containing protein [Chloroflexota bacterium]
MHIAAAQVSLHIHASSSLKDKRRVVHSVVSKLRNKHSVSAAEVGANDSWRSAKIGISIVSGDMRTADQILERALAFVEQAAPEAEVVGVETDAWTFDDV